ncbi:MAG: FG-GAP-like repeat-containing protein [Kofleriaceae bacterium]
MRALALVALIAACGDNQHGEGVPLATAHDLVVVAHEDDDLLFMQPDLLEAVRGGGGMTNVYVTAGNGTKGPAAANPRYAGLMAAYGTAANDQAWFCGWIEIAGHTAQHCRLEAENVSLVFLAYPDGGIQGELPNSLLSLWEGTSTTVTTIADRTTTYTRDELIETVAEIVRQVHPRVVHTLDLSAGHGRDHSDHMIVGALTALAIARTEHQHEPELLSYRGYDITGEPQNKLGSIYDDSLHILSYYESCAATCGTECGQSCGNIDKSHRTWLGRRYAVGFRKTASGRLRAGDQCLAGATLASCDSAPIWTLRHGQLHGPDGCLTVGAGGALSITECTDDPTERFFSDDEGHLWSGVPPDTGPDLDYAHLRCVIPSSDGSVTSAVCGGPMAPRWQWAPPLATTARATLGFAETGRGVRIGDVTGDGFGDLCAVTAAGLVCAPGLGDGTFGAAIRIDSAAAPLAIEPQSLTLGDLDGDGIADACGRDARGVLCARSTAQFAAVRFTPQFADGDAAMATSCSLRITDANGDGVASVCGIAAEGVVCSPGGSSFSTQVRSSWPDPANVIVPSDLDGDHRADWCSLTTEGPACGIAAETSVTTDGVPWGFSFGGVVETVPGDPALADIADIDGDGDGDLCTPIAGTIACARSQGHGFGPRATVAVLPDGATATAIWLGDLDGNGRADACVDLGDQIACALL